MNEEDLCFSSIADLARMIDCKDLSPVDLVEAHLNRIDKFDSILKTFITVTGESALIQARQIERELLQGGPRGPLHGIPFAVKDLYCTKDLRTTAGSKILSDFIPQIDATVICRLREAGMILLGKLNLHEFGFGITNQNPHYGDVQNPWQFGYMAGGSSGGSAAALAGGLCAGSLGTDTGGSIRIPAALCGIVGFKPTQGLVSCYGVLPLSRSLDHVGPMTRTVEDTAMLLSVLVGYDVRDSSSNRQMSPNYLGKIVGDLRGVCVGVPRTLFHDKVDMDVQIAMDAALDVIQGLGASLREVEIPWMEEAETIGNLILSAEASTLHVWWLLTRKDDYGDDVRSRLEAGRLITAEQYLKAQQRKKVLVQDMLAFFKKIDVIVLPTIPIPAPKIGSKQRKINGRDTDIREALTKFTRSFNTMGAPALAVPCGFATDGLPLSLQVIGKPFNDSLVLKVGHLYQTSTNWKAKRPSLSAIDT